MEDVVLFTQKLTPTAHGSTVLDVTYTNDVQVVEQTIGEFRRLLEEEEYKFLGLDFEYIGEYDDFEEEVAVIQLALRRKVLVFQLPRYVGKPLPSKDLDFAYEKTLFQVLPIYLLYPLMRDVLEMSESTY